METVVPYPESPVDVDERVILPSLSFKREVTRMLGAITLFVIVYLLLVAAAIVLALLAGYGGIMLIMVFPRIFTLIIGVGLIGLGVMVLFFLIKFVFTRNVIDMSALIQINKHEQPELFAFIAKLTREVGASFPRKIYLSADVNACVFYNSSFWSMFLPVRKNLQIGLGLVNSVNLSEFKAIMAHEFGHFSQRSMKLGSFVYNFNRVIYNMLYQNESYGDALSKWSSISGYFQFFSAITVGIVQGIQYILKIMYGVINKSYMSLSRQMEFHADSVAAYVSGSDHLITSLRRLEVANQCYDTVIDSCNEWIGENLQAENLYEQHTVVMHRYGADKGVPLENGFLQLNADIGRQFKLSRLVIKDQWASHPTTDDREDHLKTINIASVTDHRPAWILFRNAEELQREVTMQLYKNVNFGHAPQRLNASDFKERLEKEATRYKLNDVFKGYFDSRSFGPVDILNLPPSDDDAVENIITSGMGEWPTQLAALKRDRETINAIHTRVLPIKTFEFDGKKYSRDDAQSLLTKIDDEIREYENKIANTDMRLLAFFLSRSQSQGRADEFMSRYKELRKFEREVELALDVYRKIMTVMNPVFTGRITIEQAIEISDELKLKERLLKERINELLSDATFESTITGDSREKLVRFSTDKFIYFNSKQFNTEALGSINTAARTLLIVLSDRSFTCKKKFLEEQLILS